MAGSTSAGPVPDESQCLPGRFFRLLFTGWKNQQYLCLDAGYVGYPVSKIARKHHYHPRVNSRAEDRLIKYRYPDSKPRRWVVERTHSWFNRYRKLLVSFEKTEAGYMALLQLAAALICWRQIISIYG